ncbi:MAG: TonB-dependent receptor [Bacteroidales bacterium]|nr:TonB-dependent receptor [Bacteroidales bacterium]
MKKIYIVFFVFALLLMHSFSSFSAELNDKSFYGKVIEKKTGMPLIGVAIYFPDLKSGTSTDANGEFYIAKLPATKAMVHISYLGYKSINQQIDLSIVVSHNFEMEYTATELNEVVVTGLMKSAEQKRTPTPIAVVTHLDLEQNASTNIISALTAQPGVSQVSTGVGISKPVIRGLGYNRVVVVSDGVRQEGQQWGDEHGIEVDEYEVGRVEVLKGPASLVYGSDAMAGVVNMISLPSLPDGKIGGNVISNYQTNNGLIGYSLNLGGNKKGLIWDVRYSNKQAHAYQNRYDGYVFNSGFKENALKGMLGLNKEWGFSHLTLSAYHIQPGIVEGERDSVTGNFIKPIVLPSGEESVLTATERDAKSYTPITPFQQINHYKAVWNSNLYIGKGNLNAIIGFQQNRRQEFSDVTHPSDYQLYFLLNTWSYDFRYNLPPFNKYEFSFGVNGMQQSSRNKGVEYLVPEYNLFDLGVFSVVRRNFGTFDVSGGLRVDNRNEQASDLYLDADGVKADPSLSSATRRFAAFNSTFTGFSGSLGATWQISKSMFTKLNVSRGFRAPNIAELGANGVHEGTIRYEVGDPNLKPESSLQLDYTLGINTEHVSAELNLFDNSISHFIFLRKLNNAAGGDSIMSDQNVFKYVSGDAHLFGGEFRFDIHPHPLDWLHIENTFAFVHSIQRNQPDSTKYLPFTPPAKWQIALKGELDKWGNTIRKGYFKLELENYFAQNNIYSAYGTETETPAYSLLNVGLGADIIRKNKKICSLYLSANNLTDVAYQSHLSRLKYAATNNVTGRSGVYNMGRNVSVKLVIPIGM